ALARLGHSSARWISHELEHTSATARLSDDEVAVVLAGPDGEVAAREVGAVWLRRFRPPKAGPAMCEGDRLVAERESEAFLRGLNAAIGRRALWANSPAAQRHASLKTAQLVAARAVGLAIPRTVMTNDMEVARAFVRASRGRVIHKGFAPAVWRADGHEVVLQ